MIGLVGQATCSLRFLVQRIHSERAGRSVAREVAEGVVVLGVHDYAWELILVDDVRRVETRKRLLERAALAAGVALARELDDVEQPGAFA